MKKFIYFSIFILLLGFSSNAYAQTRSNVENIVTEDDNLDGWIDAFDVYITNSIDDTPGGLTDWTDLNDNGINTDFVVGGSYALTIDSLNTGEVVGDNIFRAHISMPSNVGTGFTGDITLTYISNSGRRIMDIYGTYLETFTPQPVFDGASPLLYKLDTFDERGNRDDYVDKIKVYFTESLNTAWFPHGSYPPDTIFDFTDDIFVDAVLAHAGFETTIFPNDTYVMDITNATTLNNGNPTIGYVPMLPRLNFTNTMAACPWALRDLFANLAVYGGGPYITNAITKEAWFGADTYIDVTFSSPIDGSTVDFSDFEVVLDGVNQTILSIAVAGTVLTLEVANIPPFLTGTNRLRLTSTYCIADILGDENIVITWVNIKDGISPSVVDLTPSDLLITDVDVGIDFTLTINYNEDMDTGTDPTITFPVEDPLNTITFNNGSWSDANTYVAHYDVVDVNETVGDIDVYIEGALDVAGNIQYPYDEADVFSIDTENPEVTNLTPDPDLITNTTNTFTLTVDYSEAMDTGTDPTITFPDEDPTNTITFNYGAWSDADTYVAYYVVGDVNETIWDIDVCIDGAEDVAGNTQIQYCETDVFDIDMVIPIVTSALTPDPELIADADVGTNTFTLKVDYSEDMLTDGTADPVITFPVEDPTNTITFNHGTWLDADTYKAYYDVVDVDETIWDIDVHIEGAIDDPGGNTQEPYDEADVFSIDTENPEVVLLTPYPDLITDADVGPNNFTLTVEYSGTMLTDGTADPVITFPAEDPTNTLTFNHGIWSYTDTYVAYYDVIDVGETVPDIDVHIEGALDSPAGNLQVIYDEADVFSIDTENPEVTDVTPDPDFITAANIGTDTFTLKVDYSEDMLTDGTADPVITFPVENPLNTITFSYGTWSDADTYVAHYDVVDVNDIISDIDVHIEGAIDSPAGNLQVPYDEADVFDINTDGPVVVLLTPDPDITDADVGPDNFTLTVKYNKYMVHNGTADPVITFPVEDPLNTLTFIYGVWTYGYIPNGDRCHNTYIAHYDVADAPPVPLGETVPDVDVHIDSARAYWSGNLQDPYDEADVFSIDTENPEVVLVTPAPIIITDADAGTGTFCLTIDYSEAVLTDGTADPVITFPVEDPTNTITFNNGSWSDADTYVACYDVVDVDEEVWDIDVHIEGAKDDPAENTQVIYDETDAFDIDTMNPVVTNVTPDPVLITDVDVGTNTFTLTVDYSEDMLTDGTADPVITFPVEDPLNTITFNNGTWSDADTYVASYDVADVDEEVWDIDVHIEGAIDDPGGNTQDPYDQADVFSIDTKNPSVVSVTPSDLLITDVDVGIDFTLTIDYNEDMLTDGTADPEITFPVEDPTNTITFNYGNWLDADTYIAHYDVIDILPVPLGETVSDIDVHIAGAKDDPAGNTQVPYDEYDVFSIDTENPVVTNVTPDPELITDADVGTNTFTLTIDYSEVMLTGGYRTSADPVITFPVEDPLSTITFNHGIWSDPDTYVAYYDVADVGETVPDIDVHVEGAQDDPGGNTQEPYDQADVFSIDTQNPEVVTITPSDLLITDADVGAGNFTVTVEYNEDMNTGTDPTIVFDPDVSSTLTNPTPSWTDATTFVMTYDVADAGVEVDDIDITVDNAIDVAGNTQVEDTEAEAFDIDTMNPLVTDVTPNPDFITDADVGAGNFTVTVEYNEDMNTGTDPTIVFDPDVSSTLTNPTPSWTDATTFVMTYDVADAGVEVDDIDITVDNAIDVAGNAQVPYTEADAFDIDTQNPVVDLLTPAPVLITDADVGAGNFTLTVEYIEDMDTGTNPTIVFTPDVSSTLTNPTPSWPNATTFVMTYDVVDVDETIWGIAVHIAGAVDDPAGNTQVPYDEADVFDINTVGPEVVLLTPDPHLITDADVGTDTFTLTVDYNEDMDTGINPIITFPCEDPTNTITFNNGSWSDPDTYVAHYDVADVNETVMNIDVHIEGAKAYSSGNIQEHYDEADVFSIDTENPISSVLTAIYNSTTGCIEVAWEASDANGIQQVELYVRIDGVDPFVLTDTDNTGNTTGTFNYCLDPSPLVCEEGTYEFYTIATDVPGNVETDLDPIVPVVVDIIATSFIITTTPESPEFGTYFDVNVAAVDDAGILDCAYSNIIHFLSNYPDDVTLPNEPLLSNGYQVYGNCIAFETMDDLIIEAYGIYPFENYSYSDPIVIQPPTIAPPTNTAAYDVPGDEGGWIYIDYVLSLNDPFHSATEMPSIHYYVVESDADTTAAGEDWQAVANVYLYAPPVGDSASVILQVPNGFVEYDYRMAAVYNQGYQTSGGNGGLESQISIQREGPLVVYLEDPVNRDLCWQSEWAYCGYAAGSPEGLSAPVITNIYIESGNVYIEWGAVDGATSYTVYSDTDPYGSFTTVEEAGITDSIWNEPVGEKKFYRVTASN